MPAWVLISMDGFDRASLGLHNPSQAVWHGVNKLVQKLRVNIFPNLTYGCFHRFCGTKLFLLQSLVEDSPEVLHGVDIVTLGGPAFHHSNPLLLLGSASWTWQYDNSLCPAAAPSDLFRLQITLLSDLTFVEECIDNLVRWEFPRRFRALFCLAN